MLSHMFDKPTLIYIQILIFITQYGKINLSKNNGIVFLLN